MFHFCTHVCIYIYIYHWRRKRGGGGGNGMFVTPPPPPHTHLTPHFYFPLELYVCVTLTNNYLAFCIYQLIILWTISINWHRWLLLNNHISKYNSFILVLYRRYINYVSVCPPPPPPPPPPPLFGTFLRHCIYIYIYILVLDISYLYYHWTTYGEYEKMLNLAIMGFLIF